MLIHPHLPAFDFFASVRGRFVKSSAKPGSHRQTRDRPVFTESKRLRSMLG